MPIPAVPARVRNYLYTFGSTAIALRSNGGVVLTADPVGCESAWWLKRSDAKQLLQESRARGDIEQAARRLKVPLTAHDVAVMRADRALGMIDNILDGAQENGGLKQFNALYKRRRMQALAVGRQYMPYTTARARLQRALVEAVAAGSQGRPFAFVMHQVLEQ